MKQSPPHSPFAWVALKGHELESLHAQCKARPLEPEGCFLSRHIVIPHTRKRGNKGAGYLPLTVSVGKDAIWVVDRVSGRLCRAVQFDGGFPSFRASLSEYGNSLRVAIGPDGSVVFWTSGHLYLWHFSSGEVRLVGEFEPEPEAIATSPAGQRVALLARWSGWLARVWSLPEGKELTLPLWDSIYCGSLADFGFSPDGAFLGLTLDVAAQSGSDFTDSHGWDLGVGPERSDSTARVEQN